MTKEKFQDRHIGPRENDVQEMLQATGYNSVNDLIDNTVPSNIRLDNELDIAEGMSEREYLHFIKELSFENKIMKSYIGMGYYPTHVPSVILRNVLENPGWYTAYTPYQAEIAQGRLEALLNFQTVVSDLTGMEIANASLLDEATAAAEAMIMFYNNRSRAKKKSDARKFFVSNEMFPQTIAVVKTRAYLLGIDLEIGDFASFEPTDEFFGALIQYPTAKGEVYKYQHFTDMMHEADCKVAVASDLMALIMLQAPGEWGADVVFGNSQRFGVPMGFGGPHAAFFATKEEYKRNIPGRIIGVSKDRLGNDGYRMALQTREQHIRREKATSNICTAQALLAVMAGMYAVYHGPSGLKTIATEIHQSAVSLANTLKSKGVNVKTENFFDTISVEVQNSDEVRVRAEEKGYNFYYNGNEISISCFEGTTNSDLSEIVEIISGEHADLAPMETSINLERDTEYLTHPVFNSYHSETELMRYLKKLENRDLSLTHAMIPLGSCTMKLNAASELMPITWPEWCNIHPFAPTNQTSGYMKMIEELERDLAEITGFHSVSVQPNSGAQGEFAGLMVIKEYHESRGDHHRDVCLIPSSAHGTNPASAVMAGMKVVVVKCDDLGNVDLDDLRARAAEHKDNLAAFMITYPSTHGVFESAIVEINQIIHDHGGQVYMDGANMNAQVGLTNPGNIGADVCHLNLHKTFAIPHGGGGPGVGPIGVAEHLSPFLPNNPIIKMGGDKATHAVSSAPWGSALILLISFGYIKMLGGEGLKKSTEMAILNANYIKSLLSEKFEVLYTGENDTVAHEMIIDCRSFKQSVGVEVEDIAKRLIDYGFHAPTVSFPVAGTVMIEPTESESKAELDRFIDAMLSIREEISEIENGTADKSDNVLKMAPHTVNELIADDWSHSYSRQKASTPLSYLMESKFWPAVARIDNAFGDRNLVCTCPSPEAYMVDEA